VRGPPHEPLPAPNEGRRSQLDYLTEERLLTLTGRLAEAEKAHSLWSKVALDPALSPDAARAARNILRSNRAALTLARKALQESPSRGFDRKSLSSSGEAIPLIAKTCSWDGLPAFWTPSEAWALVTGSWEEVNAAEVGFNAAVLSPEAFGKMFGSLPPLPQAAFTDRKRLESAPRSRGYGRQEQ
jgi:hypothetical protein